MLFDIGVPRLFPDGHVATADSNLANRPASTLRKAKCVSEVIDNKRLTRLSLPRRRGSHMGDRGATGASPWAFPVVGSGRRGLGKFAPTCPPAVGTMIGKSGASSGI